MQGFALRFLGSACLGGLLALSGLGCGGDDSAGESLLPTGARSASDAGRPPPPASASRDASPSDAGTASPPPVPPPPPPPPEPPEPTEPDAGVDQCALRETREPVTLYLSADDSNSMASPAIARHQLETGGRPSRGSLRTYEFLNYYNVRYPAPADGPLSVVPELRPGDGEGQWFLQVGLQSAPAPETPKARVITFVLDTSGSMEGEPIQREREVVRAILHGLRAGDVVNAVEWNIDRTVSLEGHVVTGPDDGRATRVADAIRAGGGTDLESGLRFGYELAERYFDPQRLNRVVLISDGQANAGITDLDLIARHADDAEGEGIYLVGVGVGDGVNDTLMDAVTDAGRGAYVYVDSAVEARRMFVERFTEVMEVGLRDVRLELTLPWYMALTDTSAEEVSILPGAVREQHLAPGDAMVFHQTLEACDLTELSLDDTVRARGTYVDPTTRERGDVVAEAAMSELLARQDVGFTRGDAIVRYARALAEADELLDAGRGEDARQVILAAREAVHAANPGMADEDLSEIEGLLDLYLDYWR